MQFLNSEKPTRVTLIKAALRTDKNGQRHLRSTFGLQLGPETPWLPKFITKAALREMSLGAIDQVRFDGVVEHANAHFAKLPDARPTQTMPDVAVDKFEARRGDDGMTLRFGFEVPFTRDVSEWLAECFGTEVWLLCDDAQPELPMEQAERRKAERGPKVSRRTATLEAGAGA